MLHYRRLTLWLLLLRHALHRLLRLLLLRHSLHSLLLLLLRHGLLCCLLLHSMLLHHLMVHGCSLRHERLLLLLRLHRRFLHRLLLLFDWILTFTPRLLWLLYAHHGLYGLLTAIDSCSSTRVHTTAIRAHAHHSSRVRRSSIVSWVREVRRLVIRTICHVTVPIQGGGALVSNVTGICHGRP